MAKVLLINSNRFKHPWPVIPFGLLYVAASLENEKSNHIEFLDLCFSKNCKEDIRRTIRNFNPDVIGISVRNIDDTGGYKVHFLLEDVKNDVIDNCKEAFDGPIVIGGPSVGISGHEMLEFFDLEYAIRGDGEAVMPEFVKRIETHQTLEGLEGLIIRRDNMIIQDSDPFRIDDLDTLPFSKTLHYLDLDLYRSFGSPIHIQTKRGCALKCSYCTYNRIEGKYYRFRNPELVADEIEFLVKETGISHIEFTDSIFNVPLTHAKQVLREIIKKQLNLKLHTMGLSPAAIDVELLYLMKKAGFTEVDIGAESMNDKILECLAKDFRRTDIEKAANLLKKTGMPVTWFMMLGAINETRDTVLETLTSMESIASNWDLVFVSTGIRVYNGAPVADQVLRNNAYCTKDNFLHPVKIEPEKISLTEIHSIAKEFSFRHPNFYFYEKEKIVPGWLLITGNTLLRIFNSRQPVWRFLILKRRIGKIFSVPLLKEIFFRRKKPDTNNGFSLVRNL
jgi:anaerobic magnesium-protoporphyrin IX monomethyl ester cyclase